MGWYGFWQESSSFWNQFVVTSLFLPVLSLLDAPAETFFPAYANDSWRWGIKRESNRLLGIRASWPSFTPVLPSRLLFGLKIFGLERSVPRLGARPPAAVGFYFEFLVIVDPYIR